jgi:CBS domain containing-hemolysin-like protein
MATAYSTLPMKLIPAPVGFCSPEQPLAPKVGIDHPASAVMTDLTKLSAVIIRSTDTIDEALARMKQRGVRLLLVIDNERLVVGLITANDVLGEKPMRLVESNIVRHQDILVRDVMTPWQRLEAIAIKAVEAAKVGQVVATLRASGRQHALVADHDGRIRGIFSATQIARQLGVDPQSINPAEIAQTFAEIESSLAR